MPEAVATQTPQQQLPLGGAQSPAAAPTQAPVQRVRGRFELPPDPEPSATLTPSAQEKAPETPPKEQQAESAEQAPATDAQNKGEEAPPAEPEAKPEDEKPDTPEQAAKRQQRRFERRLDKLYRERAEAQARAEAAERRLTELNQPKAPQGEPKLEDFDYDPVKYGQAMVEWGKTQASKEIEGKQREETQRQYVQRLTSTWEEAVAKAEESFDDFHEVVGEIHPTSALSAAIMSSDPAVAYYLGKHTAEAEKLAGMPPLDMARAIGKLEAKLLTKPVEPKAPSRAPAPITPVSGVMASPPTDGLESQEISDAEWIKRRRKQIAARRG